MIHPPSQLSNIYVVQPPLEATSTNSSSLLLSSANQLHAQSLKNPTLHRTGDLRTLLDPPSPIKVQRKASF